MSGVLELGPRDAHAHVVQFYESDADLIAGAGAYLSEGLQGGCAAIVIATTDHREAFSARLRSAGVDVDEAMADGALVVLDASAALARFTRDGVVDRDAFFEIIGGHVRAAAATGRPVRAYGEMVALLWDAGHVMAAIELETLWNELAEEVSFALYCAYPSHSVSGHEQLDALEQVCHLHSAVTSPAAGPVWHFPAELTAPADARRVVADRLRDEGHGPDLIDDARLVVTELAANAVMHARTPFSVALEIAGASVRIRVRDRSPRAPTVRASDAATSTGRGLGLVADIAHRWGVDAIADGKVVWAELGAEAR